jgi:FG-GAP repeat protein/VCBS repeat protein
MSQPFPRRSVSTSLALALLGATSSAQGHVRVVDDGAPNHGALWILDLNADGSLESQAETGGISFNPPEHLNDNGYFGSAAATLGDIDGDGRLELAVGSHGLHDQRGEVWILSRGADGRMEHRSSISALAGEQPFEGERGFGSALATVGDLDDDGIPELAVGAPSSDSGQGSIRILFLAADGSLRGSQRIGEGLGGFQGNLSAGDSFGSSLAALADIDGDGAPELAVGMPSPSSYGSLLVLSLEPSGTVRAQRRIGRLTGGFDGEILREDFGASVAAIGDVDGDGIGDLAVGAPGSDDGGTDRGAVWILFLALDGTVDTHQKISRTSGDFVPADVPLRFGASVAPLGDLDDDGTPDIAVGAPETAGRGSFYILFLDPDGTCKSHVQPQVAGVLAGDRLGSSLAALGDLDGDGRHDVGVGAETRDGILVPGALPTLQGAIDASSEGDTILVHSGTYAGLTLVGKAVDIVAARDAIVSVALGIVRDLPAGKRVMIDGLRFVAAGGSPIPKFTATNLAGALWLQRCEFPAAGLDESAPAVLLDSCSKVAFLGCRAKGSTQSFFCCQPGSLLQTGHGLTLQGGCRVAAYDSEFRGADGYVQVDDGPDEAIVGGMGIRSTSAGDEIFASNCEVLGGMGTTSDPFFFPINCSTGGAGLSSAGIARVLDCVVRGGPPGDLSGTPCNLPGPDRLGNVVTVRGRSLRLTAPTVVRPGEDLELDLTGPRGVPVWILSDERPFQLFSSHDRGVLLVHPTATIEFLGFTDLSGELHVTSPAPPLPSGAGAAKTFVQVLYQDLGEGGSTSTGRLASVQPRFVLGSALAITTLDPSF